MNTKNRLDPSSGPPNINPDDVAVYLEVKLKKSGTERELATAMGVERAMEADPNVRAYVEELLRLTDPAMHPENHPSPN